MRRVWVAFLPLLLAGSAWAEVGGTSLQTVGASDEALFAEAGRPIQVAFVRRVARSIRRAARRIGRRIGGAVRRVVRGVGRAVRKAGTVFRKVDKAVRTVAKKAGRVIKKVGKAVKKVGKKVVAVAKKVGKAVWKGIKTLGQFVLKSGKWVIEKVKKFLSSKLGQLVMKYLPKIQGYLGKVWGGNLRWLATITKIVNTAAKVQDFLQKYVAKPLSVIDSILGKRHYLTYARDPNALINAGKQKLKSWVTEKIMGLVMGLVKKLAEQVTESLIAFGLKIVKHPITTAIAAWIASAVASVTYGIGAVLKPAIKWVLDQLMDKWAIPKLAKMLVGKGVSFVENYLRTKILPKIVDKPIDKVVDYLVSKYLQKWIDAYKSGTANFFDKVENVVDKVQSVVDKVWAGLNTVNKVVSVLQKIRDAYKKTCKNVIELCRAIARDYQAAKTDVTRLRGKPEVVDAMMKVVLLRKSYAQNRCQYGRYY